MIKIIEDISQKDYTEDILNHIRKTRETINDVERTIIKSPGKVSLDDILALVHDLYNDAVIIQLVCSKQ